MSHPFKHFILVQKHRHQVMRNGWHLGIFWQTLRHDLSKFSPTEFNRGAKYYVGNHSPIYEERLRHNFSSEACLHHTKRNKHHWEHYVDFFRGRIVARNMPYKYALEYVADTLAASKTYNPKDFKRGTTLEYFLNHSKSVYMSDVTREFITWMLTEYRDNGWKNLKKKYTKKKYEEIAKMHPETKVFEALNIQGDLPLLKEGV